MNRHNYVDYKLTAVQYYNNNNISIQDVQIERYILKNRLKQILIIN